MSSFIEPITPDQKQWELFYIGSTRIEKTDTGHYWVRGKSGRARFVRGESELGQRIAQGILDQGKLGDRPLTATGTFTPVVYYRTPDGAIGIPPSPDAPLPANAIRCEARNLREIDSVTREMNIADREKFRDDGSFRENFAHEILGGDPREALRHQLTRSISNEERDFIHLALADSERMEQSAKSLTAHSMFHFREFDK